MRTQKRHGSAFQCTELGQELTASGEHSNYSKQAVKMIEDWHRKLANAGARLQPAPEIEFGGGAEQQEAGVFERDSIDLEAYDRMCQTRPCFICGIVARHPDFPAHIVHEDELAIAFLDKYPTLYGYTLVAPRDHREQVTGDFSIEEYLALQRRVYWVAEAVRREVDAERVYLLSLGSNQGNAHVHWHVAPLPPGVPFDKQQLNAIGLSRGVLRIPEEEQAALASRLRCRVERLRDQQS